MFTFTFPEAATFKAVVEATRELVESVNFTVDDSGVWFSSMDSAHVALIHARFPKIYFSNFSVDGASSFGVNMASLSKVLKFADSERPLTFCLGESGDDLSMQSGSANILFKLMDIESEEFSMPEFERDASVTMSSSDFRSLVKDLSAIGDTAKIAVTEGEATFETSGDVGTVSVRVANGDGGSGVTGSFIGSEFSLKYLVSFAKASAVSKTTRLVLAGDMPAELEFENISFFLAPKISDDFDPIEEDV